VNNVLNIATTNYPEKLDKRIVSRPRRFDRIEKIGTPTDNMRREFFRLKAGIKEEDELNLWVNSTKDFSFAALSDLIISIKCFGYEFDVAINKLRKILDSKPSSEEFNSKPGFFL
jgi:SpoVK/Ycf46/Vps4 family AAA+-type ATPase